MLPADFVTLLRRGLSRPTIWHLHGCIDNPTGMILSPDGYNLLYVSDSKRQPQYEAALHTLRNLLISKTLFIGFSFDVVDHTTVHHKLERVSQALFAIPDRDDPG